MDLDELKGWLDGRLPELLEEQDVPAAAVAISYGGEVVEAAAGVLSRATGVEATTDAVFQVGSITKTWTATLAMQLVEEGRLDLDVPVRDHLPGFRVADEAATRTVTTRQLLSHTSGFEGDIFTDTGRGDDCIERFLDVLHDVPQLFAPGEMFSYNNAGFSVLGRIVEVLRGKPFDECLREHLIRPLGLTHVACDPYEAVLYRTAVGHPTPAPTTTWALARSNAPAGAMLAMSARDLITFAQAHLNGGRDLLEPETALAMQRLQVDQPHIAMGTGWGLGFELWALPGGFVFGHDGNTIGQSGFLRMAPEHDLAVAILSNGGSPKPMHQEIGGRVLRELAGIDLPVPPVPDPEARVRDPERYLGTYESVVGRTVISEQDGRVWLDHQPLGVLAEIHEPDYRTELVAWQGDSLLPVTPQGGEHTPVAFLGDDGRGRALYLHGGRADRRAEA